MLRLSRWTAGTLLGTWAAYWAMLIGVSLGPGLLAAWRLTRGQGSHGKMIASLDNGHLLLQVHDAAGAMAPWTFNTSITSALAWIALPPLALWVVWLVSRPRRDALLAPHDPMLNARGGEALDMPERTPAADVRPQTPDHITPR